MQDAEGNWGYKPNGADTVYPFNMGKLILGCDHINNPSLYFKFPMNDVIAPTRKYDFTPYKYLIIIIRNFIYYQRTFGLGYTDMDNPTYAQAKSTPTKVTKTFVGTGVSKDVIGYISIDISAVQGKKTPFTYNTSEMYDGIYKWYFSNTLPEEYQSL